MSTLLMSAKAIAAIIVTLAGSGAFYQFIVTQLNDKIYQPIGKMVDIGGYKLHMIDNGTGGPVVVLDAGAGCDSLDWSLVQPQIAEFTRVISYDRAGHTWSDKSPMERTSKNIAKELHSMLHAANIPAPYILVGHSFGGINVRMFANMYPDEVAGIVLVDSSHELQFEALPSCMQIPSPWLFKAIKIAAYLGVYQIPSVQKTLGFKTEKFSPEIQRAYRAKKISTKNFATGVDEGLLLSDSLNQLKAMNQNLGDKPLTVITAGISIADQCPGRFTTDQANQIQNAWITLQENLVTKSTQSKQIFAQNSGHMINYDQPEIIVEAVRKMIDNLK